MFFSVFVIPCFNNSGLKCFCHYDQIKRVNIYNCSANTIHSLPVSIPNYTDWLLLENNNIKSVINVDYINDIHYINLRNNGISFLNNKFLIGLKKSKTPGLNLAENNIVSIPQKFTEMTNLKKIWLGGNPFRCDCSTIWMIRWINNFTISDGTHVIIDYLNVKCSSGKMIGIPIFVLTEVELGCFPSKWTVLQKVGVGIGVGLGGIIIMILMSCMIKKSREVRFFIFYKLKLHFVSHFHEKANEENIENKEYDAYLSYRSVVSILSLSNKLFIHDLLG